jgi:hypothetical protein
MKKLLKKINILALLLIFLVYLFPLESAAKNEIYNIKITDFKDNQATLTCTTSDLSKVNVYFGNSEDNLNFSVNSSLYEKYHETKLTGLSYDINYYYKIIATDKNNNRSESFIGYLPTDDMEDTENPKLSYFKIKQITNKAIYFSLESIEKIRVSIKYGNNLENLNKHWGKSRLEKKHSILLKNLEPGSNYYLKITLEDDSKNSIVTRKNFTTKIYDSYNELKIRKLDPESYNQAQLLARNFVITWESNVLADSKIFYGTDPERLNKRQNVEEDSLTHKAVLENLEPSTIYYYKIEMKSDMNSKKITTGIQSFKTLELSWNYLNLYFHSGDIIKNNRITYLIYKDKKIPFRNDRITSNYTNEKIETDTEDLEKYETISGYWGNLYTGDVAKEADKSTVYVIDGKYKKPLANYRIFKYLNYNINDIKTVSRDELKNYETTEIIKHSKELTKTAPLKNLSLVKSPEDSDVYLIANEKKLPFLNANAFLANGYNFSQVQTVPWYKINSIPVGQVIIK